MKKIKLGMIAALAFSICMGVGSVKTYAKVKSVLVKDTSAQKVYEYNLSDLNDSIAASQIGESSPLYDDYNSKVQKFNVYAVYDDTNKYVDFSKVIDAFTDAQMNQSPFILDDFTSSANAPLVANTPTTLTDVSVSSTGTLTFTDKTIGTNPDSSDFSVISIE